MIVFNWLPNINDSIHIYEILAIDMDAIDWLYAVFPPVDCNMDSPVILTLTEGYIGPRASCPNATTTLHLKVRRGRKLRIKLLNFDTTPSNICHVYATIAESGGSGSKVVCRSNKAKHTVYVTRSESLDVMLLNSYHGKFLLHYEGELYFYNY